MKLHLARLILFSALALSTFAFATTALAQEHGDGESESHGGSSFIGGPDWGEVREVTIWSLVSIAGGGALLGVLYLFKRKIGAFPENPTWVAPITIMPASELPGDDDAHGHGDADHGNHAPAH
jgi:hypothetical protein